MWYRKTLFPAPDVKNALILLFALPLLLSGCSTDTKPATATVPHAPAPAAPDPALTPQPTAPAPTVRPDSAAAAVGFDPASAPVSTGTLGAWPYFGPLKGYEALSKQNRPGDSARELQKDVGFDHYDFFDGVKLIPVEGRRFSVKYIGKDASFFEFKKNYESVIKSLGGVTVYEGTGEPLEAAKRKFPEGSHRGRYWLKKDEMGVYFLRTPDKEIWVEAYHPFPVDNTDYWLTVVEKKALEVTVQVLPAEALKKALDTDGHVALYINFDTDKTAMKAESAPIVAEVVKLLTANPALKLTVEGHTDNAGTPAHNQTLSEGRANAVVGALMAQGISLDRLQAKGFGQQKPLVANDSEASKAKNRRVELVKR